MNKLVIIGNGFDLAHGLKTRYEDFILWFLNKRYFDYSDYIEGRIYVSGNKKKDKLLDITGNGTFIDFEGFQSVPDFYDKTTGAYNIKCEFHDPFFEEIVKLSDNNWVDVEREYYKQLLKLSNKDEVVRLNESLDAIKIELAEYLSQLESVDYNEEIGHHLYSLKSNSNYKDLYILNFNYTSNIEKYVSCRQVEEKLLNYIHGKLKDIENPIIFGYGDETDENYEKIEKLNENEFLKHMKSFAYLQTPNYKNLFEFLDREDMKFEVHIMGHSCGLSDRLLFTHILEHHNLHSVKIYYYEREDGTNDFFEKTQELSRYFRKDEKHKMRKVIVPFNESVPLVKYKPKQQN
jgi:hypothetical protein